MTEADIFVIIATFQFGNGRFWIHCLYNKLYHKWVFMYSNLWLPILIQIMPFYAIFSIRKLQFTHSLFCYWGTDWGTKSFFWTNAQFYPENKKSSKPWYTRLWGYFQMVRQEGLEPPTHGLEEPWYLAIDKQSAVRA